MLKFDLDNFKQHLTNKGVKFDFQKETNQILVVNKVENVEKAENIEFPLFIRLIEESEVVQFLLFFPTTIKESALNDLARSLLLLNKELDIPGFGIDEKNKLVYFRTLIPCSKKECDPVIFDKIFLAVQMIGQSFLPLVAAASQGLIDFKEVQNKLSQMMPKGQPEKKNG